MPKRILVAAAWPYANGPRHVGHVAGFAVPSDVFARYHRLRGNEVLFVSGTDEHGTPITVAADREGITPRALADRYNAVIRDDLHRLGMSYDLFTRTTTANHYAIVQRLFSDLLAAGRIFEQTALGAFSATTGRTLPDRYIEGTCPNCGYDSARGDQCDNCGRQLDPADLIDPRSTIDGEPPVFRETEHWFLDLPAFAERLRAWIGAAEHWRPNVRRQSLGLVEDLRPRAVTRDMEWGVPIPLPQYAERRDKVIYVWFDAVIGYLSASVEWAGACDEPDAWRRWWADPQAESFYFMGKDNIVFHTVIWPSMLLGAGEREGAERLNLPTDVVSSEFLTMEGQKFSSSRGVVIYVGEVLDRYDADALRYHLTAAGPETQDTNFTWAEFARRNNEELLAKWGNLAHRVLTMSYRNFGRVPEPGEREGVDDEVLADVNDGFEIVGELIERGRLRAALAEVMGRADALNEYLSRTEPWKLMREHPARAATVLNTALQGIANLCVMAAPFLPFSSQRLHETLGYPGLVTDVAELGELGEGDDRHGVLTRRREPLAASWAPRELPAGQELREPVPLFRRIEQAEIDAELGRLEQAAGAA